MEKGRRLFVETIFKKNLMAKHPDKKAVTVPRIRGKTSAVARVNSPETKGTISRIAEPKITGIDIKKEKSADSFLSTPTRLKAVIVAPLRDTPGKTAIP